MKSFILALAACLLLACTPVPAQGNSAPGQFDFYLLNLSWSPEYCVTHASAAECAAHLGFIVHGLWPQTDTQPWPEDCSNAPGPTDPSQWTDITPDPSLLEHEWQKHGTCSGLSADAFFGLERKAFHSVVIPPALVNLNHPLSLPPKQIMALFTKANPTFPTASVVVSCGNNQLTAIEVCMAKDLTPMACTGVKACHANTVKIPPQIKSNMTPQASRPVHPQITTPD
jgi:ribonuclease T2